MQNPKTYRGSVSAEQEKMKGIADTDFHLFCCFQLSSFKYEHEFDENIVVNHCLEAISYTNELQGKDFLDDHQVGPYIQAMVEVLEDYIFKGKVINRV